MATEAELGAVKDRHAARLLREPGVYGIGVQREPSGEFVLAVHVDPSVCGNATSLPREIEGHLLKVVSAEEFRAQ